MKLRSIAILSAIAVASAVAHAQSGVYATFDAQLFNRSGIFATAPASGNSDSPWLYGPTIGAFYTIHKIPKLGELKTGPISLGIDGRGDFLHGSLYDRSDAIVSLRVTPKNAFKGGLVPYIQGGAGLGHTKVPHAVNFSNNWNYQFSVGADRKIKGHLDWRVVEVSGGFLGNYIGGLSSTQSNYNITLATGLVFHPY